MGSPLNKALSAYLILAFCLVTSGCGWVLTGTQIDETVALSQVQYEADISIGLSRILERRFSGSETENPAEHNKYLVSIFSEIQTERVQSVTAGLRSNQLRMEKQVHYQISTLHDELVETGTALVWRDLDMDEFTPGATEREKALLQEEIDQEIVRQILSHLERFDINNAT